jgi:predicted kinase
MGLPDADDRWVYLEIDALFTLLTPHSDRNRQDRMLAYDAAHALARLLLDRGRTPVLECTYSRREQRASLLRELAERPAPL